MVILIGLPIDTTTLYFKSYHDNTDTHATTSASCNNKTGRPIGRPDHFVINIPNYFC